MSFKSDLRSRALEDAGLSALLGRQIHWSRRPQGKGLPALVMHRITAGQTYTQDGPDPTITPTIQFDILGATEADLEQVETALRAFIHSLTTAPFQGGFILTERDDFEPEPGASDAEILRTSIDARIVHDAAG